MVINLRLYKNAKQKLQNERMQIYPKFKIFDCTFFEYNSPSIFVKFELSLTLSSPREEGGLVDPPPFFRLLKFYFRSDVPETLWLFSEFIWGDFTEIFFLKNHTHNWWRHRSWTLVSWNFSHKKVSIFCMLLCCSCLR